jgi:N-acyl amino acid synthase of PEP-CTERM/exosortase system
MQLFDRFNLGHGFRKYFEIHPAIDDTLRDEVFRIRHEVYCEELAFEPVRPDCREFDEYDAHSLHCLMRTSAGAHEPVGCTRLVLARPGDPHYLLPFERTCAYSLDRSIVDPSRLPRDRIAEVSRLAVRARFRRRRGDHVDRVPIHDEDFGSVVQPRFPYIPIGLYLGAIALASRGGIDTLFVLTEPRLASHFSKLGVEVTQIGEPVEHRGTRIPSMMNVQGIIKGMRFLVKPMWRVIREEMEESFECAAGGARLTDLR